jgi:hypothetical protein
VEVHGVAVGVGADQAARLPPGDRKGVVEVRGVQLGDRVAGPAQPLLQGGEAVRVQVLNGVGVPGVGQEVDRLLDRGAFRIVLSDNARSFDFDATQILVYDESERSLAAAQRVQELLGVGTIQVSRQPQSVIDLTIVVGSDFVEAHEALGD